MSKKRGEQKRGKPGPGWKLLGPAVYEHATGVRIHVMGLVRLRDGSSVFGSTWPESQTMDRFIRINGGNRRRGVMAYGLDLTTRRESEAGK